MNGIVLFDYNYFSLRFPELAQYVQQALAQLYWNEAGLLCDNTANSPITDDSVGGQRYIILHLACAHVCALNAPLGAPSAPLVGRIASAGEGSVNVSLQNDYPPGSAQWFQQTKYGSAFWGATKQFRSFRYVAKHRRNMDGYAPFGWPR
jgi:hypothetical protein